MTEPGGRFSALLRPLESEIDTVEAGLPEELFLFVSRVTPLVNVDLLIQDDQKHTLLTWWKNLIPEQHAYAALIG